MFGVVLSLIVPWVLFLIIRAGKSPSRVMQVMMAGYFARIVGTQVLREIPFFSHGTGGDCNAYEMLAWVIAKLWESRGVEFITSDQIAEIGPTSLPPNLFAFVIYLNGGDVTRIGCVSLIALAATLCCYNLYTLGCQMGADEDMCLKVSAAMLFSPGYFFYTADLFKDGLVAFLVIAALGSGFRLAKKFSVLQLVLAGLSVYALWYVRFYLIFLALAPLAIGVLGAGKKSSILRPVFILLMATLMMGVVGNSSRAVDELSSRASQTFSAATSNDARDWNRIGGSGVEFDDGGNALGAIHLKLIYTLFSPFPWQGGSIAMHIGKIDALIWYYLAYRAFLATKQLWKGDRTLLLMFLVFLVPCTVAYATTMSNVGLILRQRIPVILIGSLLSMLSWPASRNGRISYLSN